MRTKLFSAISFAAMAACSLGASAAAVSYDLTTKGSEANINGAIFYVPLDTGSSGSGVISSFVRIQSNEATVQGYNTSDRPLQFDENSSPTFTRDLLLTELPKLTVGGVEYYEFLLDINQEGSDPLFSLNRIHIFSGANQATTLTSFSTGGNTSDSSATLGGLTSIYSLDTAANNNTIELNYNNYGGSGASMDMAMLVPTSLFSGPYVYLYSFFGAPNDNNDGYEEWAVRTRASPTCPPSEPDCDVPIIEIPEPGSLALFGLGLTGLALIRRRRR